MWNPEKDAKSNQCAVAVVNDANSNMIDECSVPKYGDPLQFDLPTCEDVDIGTLLDEYKDLFRSIPGLATLENHHIPTTGTPVRVPSRRVPVHYNEEVEHQIKEMLQKEIIEESTSPWMAPAVFVKKSQVTFVSVLITQEDSKGCVSLTIT